MSDQEQKLLNASMDELREQAAKVGAFQHLTNEELLTVWEEVVKASGLMLHHAECLKADAKVRGK